LLLASIFLLSALWLWGPDFGDILSREGVLEFITVAQQSNLSILWIAVIYVVAGAFFFPITVLNLTTAIVFGPVYGLLFALFGSLLSASVAFVVGRFIGERKIFNFKGTLQKVRKYVRRGGIMGM